MATFAAGTRVAGSCCGRFTPCRARARPGVETWEGESWKNRSGTNAWSYMTVDVERGLVFAPTGSPTSDFYGADRKGQNLYGNCLIALDAATGKLKWFQQLVHHDIWDWDLPAAPMSDRRRPQRPPRARRRADDEDEHALHLRPRDRRAALRARRTARAAERRAGRGHVADAAVPAQPAAALAHDLRSREGLLHAHARARGLLPRPLGHAQDVHEGHLHAARARRHDGDVSEHARRRQLERAVVTTRGAASCSPTS